MPARALGCAAPDMVVLWTCGSQHVIPPVIISAVFDPNERPRWERILHEMLVESRKPSTESIQIFKVSHTNTRTGPWTEIETRAFKHAHNPSGADPRLTTASLLLVACVPR